MGDTVETKIFNKNIANWITTTKSLWAFISTALGVLATIAVLGYKYAKYEAKNEISTEKIQEIDKKIDQLKDIVIIGIDSVNLKVKNLESKFAPIESKVGSIDGKIDNVTTSMERHIVKSSMSSDEMINQLNILRGVISLSEKKNSKNFSNLSSMNMPIQFLQTQYHPSNSSMSPEQLALKK